MVEYDLTNPYELAKYIKNARKTTPIKLTIQGHIIKMEFTNLKVFKSKNMAIAYGEYEDIKKFIDENKIYIEDYYIECDRRNSALPILDIKNIDARIEPGAIIREGVIIGKGAIIMMGAVINIGAEIGEGTMIDMNAVIGARASIGKNAHIGAGVVVAGVLEPPSKTPVIIEDNVVIGANSVILEGVRIGNGAVVGALSVVTKDVESNAVVVGSPAKKVKNRDEVEASKVEILEDLRDINA